MICSQSCTKCLLEKTFSEFNKRSNGKYGLRRECKNCMSNIKSERRLKNLEEHRIKDKTYYDNNRESICYTKKIYGSSDKKKLYYKNYRLNNLEKISETHKKYYQNNKSKYYAKTGTRRAIKLQATVAWANLDIIKLIYYTAKFRTNTGTEIYEVHHIVPLNSSIVCGLHCEANLAIITQKLNRTIGNRSWPDMP